MHQHDSTSREIAANQVYTTSEAARLLRCKPPTITRAVCKGRIRAGGRPFRILGSELIRFALEGNK